MFFLLKVWPPKNYAFKKWPINNELDCDLSDKKPPYNLCVYGALDTKEGCY